MLTTLPPEAGSLKERLEAEMRHGDANGNPIKQSQVAREIGMSDATISGYMNGTYKGDVAALEEKIRKWIRGRDNAKSHRACRLSQNGSRRRARSAWRAVLNTPTACA